MGLDMYLKKRIYIGANYEHRKVKAVIEITVDEKPVKINNNKVSYIEEEAIYWRKANHIHNWFVINCCNGEDECREEYVSKEKLKELMEVCQKVMNDNSLAEKLLPTKSGFFFGGTDYDEYYFQEIESTYNDLRHILSEEDYSEYYYRASW